MKDCFHSLFPTTTLREIESENSKIFHQLGTCHIQRFVKVKHLPLSRWDWDDMINISPLFVAFNG